MAMIRLKGRLSIAALAASLSMIAAVTARAASVVIDMSWSYNNNPVSPYGPTYTTELTLPLSPTSTPGVYQATGISGTAHGFTNLSLTTSFNSADNLLYYPGTMSANCVFSTCTDVDSGGVEFTFGDPSGSPGEGGLIQILGYGPYYIYDTYLSNLGYGGLTIESIQFNFSSGVPDAGTWALMFCGVAAVGGAMRQARNRRRSVVVAGV